MKKYCSKMFVNKILQRKVTPLLFSTNSLNGNKTASHSMTKLNVIGKVVRYLTEDRNPFKLVNALFGEIFLKFRCD